MGQIIGMINEKGGVGKTTGITTMSEILGIAGHKVLIIDLDPQMNATSIYKDEDDEFELDNNQYLELFCNPSLSASKVDAMIYKSKYENISLLPSSKYLKDLIYEIHNKNIESKGSITPIFYKNIKHLKDKFDYIMIDNSPFDTEISRSTICASDNILTPIRPDNFSFEGIISLMGTINEINNKYHVNVKFLGIYINQAKPNTVIYRQLSEQYGEQFDDVFIPILIREANAVYEANTVFEPLVTYAKKCNPVDDYIHLLSAIGLLDLKHYRKVSAFIRGGKTIG